MDIYHKTNNLGERTSILSLLVSKAGDHEKSEITHFLLDVAKSTDSLRTRYVAVTSIQQLTGDYSGNPFNWRYFEGKL